MTGFCAKLPFAERKGNGRNPPEVVDPKEATGF
jgi:hypothetical protein